MFSYSAHVTKVVDGDTFDAVVDLGFSISINTRFRLLNIDTPEKRTRNKKEKKHGLAATERAKELIEGKDVVIETSKTGKYGRYLAKVYLPEKQRYLFEILIEEGFSKRTEY